MAIFVHGGKIYTMSYKGTVDALLTVAGRVLAAGSEAEVRKYLPAKFHDLDLKGKAVFPGFHDSHIHFLMQSLGQKRLNLAGVAPLRRS